MIEIRNLTIAHDCVVLKDANYIFNKEEYTVITGKSGVGKTSLLMAIGSVFNDYQGDIIVNGKLSSKETVLRENISYCFQEPIIYSSMTLYDNILLGAKCKKIKKELPEEKIKKLCHYLDLNIDLKKKTTNLSGGEKQKINFLRSYLLNPSILILDEPMSAMDRLSKEKIKGLLLEMKNNTTIIHVSHDSLEYSGLVDKIVKIENKKIISEEETNDY